MLKRLLIPILLCLSPVTSYADNMFDKLSLECEKVGAQVFTSSGYRPGITKHIVLFRYKGTVTAEQKEEIVKRFLDLRYSKRPSEQNPYILSITTGRQNSGEKVSMRYEQAFIVTFRSEGDRNYYVGSPLVNDPIHYDRRHAEFKEFVGPLLANNNGVLVFDFNSEASVE